MGASDWTREQRDTTVGGDDDRLNLVRGLGNHCLCNSDCEKLKTVCRIAS